MNPVVPDDKAVYPIGVASQLLDLHPRTLRIYEAEGLIKPSRKGNKRYFSNNDLTWIRCIREMIHGDGISIAGIKRLIELLPCWEVKRCPDEVREKCTAQIDKRVPCWKLARWACPNFDTNVCEDCEIYQRDFSLSRKAKKNPACPLKKGRKGFHPPKCVEKAK